MPSTDGAPVLDHPIPRQEVEFTIPCLALGPHLGERTGRLGGEQCPGAPLTGGTTIRPSRERAGVG